MARGGKAAIAALIVLALAATECKRVSPLDTRAIGEWADGEGYSWVEGPDEIRTEQAFFDFINGAAQPIIDLGWKRSVFGILEKGEDRLRLTVHQMTRPQGAVTLLEQNLFEDVQPVAVGERGVYWDRGTFSRGILFRKGAFACELTLEKEGSKEKAVGLASSLAARIE